MRILFLLSLFIASTTLFAQVDNELLDIVETHNGERYEGKIIYLEYGKLLTIVTQDGSEITLSNAEIRKLHYSNRRSAKRQGSQGQKNTDDDALLADDWRSELVFKKVERRLRPSFSFMFHGGKSSNGGNTFFSRDLQIFGYSLEGMVNYRVWPALDVGLGLALDRFNAFRGESTLSYTGGIQILPNRKKAFAPYFRLVAGYADPIKTEKNNFFEKDGGVLLNPAVGIRIGRTNRVFYTIDLGYRILDTELRLESPQGLEIRSNAYRRLGIRFGATI